MRINSIYRSVIGQSIYNTYNSSYNPNVGLHPRAGQPAAEYNLQSLVKSSSSKYNTLVKLPPYKYNHAVKLHPLQFLQISVLNPCKLLVIVHHTFVALAVLLVTKITA